MPLLLTVSTVAGMELAEGKRMPAALTWLPFDVHSVVRRFVKQVQPRALVLVETEIWPNLVRETRRAGAPVVVVNGRISAKNYPKYARFRWLLGPAFSALDRVAVQNSEYQRRFVALGALPERVRVAGCMKFDAVACEVDAKARLALRVTCGYAPDQPLLVFGSTRPGDEALAASCWRVVKDRFPGLALVVAPRHGQRLAEALADFGDAGEITLLSEVRAGKSGRAGRVLFVDTVGDLVNFYALASIAVIGGSFYPGVEGHNPLEPAALGVATVFGPYMGNFPEAAQALLEGRGAEQVAGPEQLADALLRLLGDPQSCRALGTLGRKAVMARRGATERNLECILSAMDAACPAVAPKSRAAGS